MKTYEIQSYKHNRKIHRTWAETFILCEEPDLIGVNERCRVTEADQKVWTTKDPAVVIFPKGKWFNIVGMLTPQANVYYCNIISPIEHTEKGIRYIDYDIDIILDRGAVRVVDEDEYSYHKNIWGYSDVVDRQVHAAVKELLQWIDDKKGPFEEGFLNYWYSQYKVRKGEV